MVNATLSDHLIFNSSFDILKSNEGFPSDGKLILLSNFLK